MQDKILIPFLSICLGLLIALHIDLRTNQSQRISAVDEPAVIKRMPVPGASALKSVPQPKPPVVKPPEVSPIPPTEEGLDRPCPPRRSPYRPWCFRG